VARTPFRVEVLTPEGSVFDDEVEFVSTRTEVGSIGIMARHQPLLGLLVPTELRLYRSETDIVSYAQGEGYVQVSDDGVLVLVEEAQEPSALDAADLRDKLRKAEDAYAAAEPHTEEQRRAGRDKRRWDAFLRIAEGDKAA
jgi:F-type H+-transporting ATPase subunit epsilon